MRIFTLGALLICILLISGYVYVTYQPSEPEGSPAVVDRPVTEETFATSSDDSNEVLSPNDFVVIIGIENLTIPWEVLFLPDGELLITERPGRVVLLEDGQSIEIDEVRHVGEGGLLGAALHPEFDKNQYLYLYQTTDAASGLVNRIDRYTLRDTELTFDRTILDNIPGARYHDGGRIAFGPDNMLYATVGDATDEAAAQSLESLAGSILRMTPEGAVPEDNPFPNSYIYSYGHRNPQGLTWTSDGQLWSTEHGRSGIRSGYDELNRIEPGGNYGWPESQGDEVKEGTIAPAVHSGSDTTWAPASAQYLGGSIYFAGLRGETLYEAVLNDDETEVVELREHLVGEYGRLRTVTAGPEGLLYVTTSNRDGRTEEVADNDDVLLIVNPDRL